jgi:hypothetical protein
MPVAVGEPADRQQRRRDRDEIGDDHPLDLSADRLAEVVGDRRQADVDDRGVERAHEPAGADDREDVPLARHFYVASSCKERAGPATMVGWGA